METNTIRKITKRKTNILLCVVGSGSWLILLNLRLFWPTISFDNLTVDDEKSNLVAVNANWWFARTNYCICTSSGILQYVRINENMKLHSQAYCRCSRQSSNRKRTGNSRTYSRLTIKTFTRFKNRTFFNSM